MSSDKANRYGLLAKLEDQSKSKYSILQANKLK